MLLRLLTVCCTKKTKLPLVTAVGFVIVNKLPEAWVNITSLAKVVVSKAYCEFKGDTKIAQLIPTPSLEITVLAPLKIDWGADPDNCKVVLYEVANTGISPAEPISVWI